MPEQKNLQTETPDFSQLTFMQLKVTWEFSKNAGLSSTDASIWRAKKKRVEFPDRRY